MNLIFKKQFDIIINNTIFVKETKTKAKMKTVKIIKIKNFIDFVQNMDVNICYELPDNSIYKYIEIEKGIDCISQNVYFKWVIKYNYQLSGNGGYILPMSSTNVVHHFKTEKGCKRNLIKNFGEYFKSIEDD